MSADKPETTKTEGDAMKSRDEVLKLLDREMESLDMTEGAIATDDLYGGDKVAQLSKEDREVNAKNLGHALLSYLSHFGHLSDIRDTEALRKLKSSLLNIEGGLMTKAAMMREEQKRSVDNIYDFRCDVVSQTWLGVQNYLDLASK